MEININSEKIKKAISSLMGFYVALKKWILSQSDYIQHYIERNVHNLKTILSGGTIILALLLFLLLIPQFQEAAFIFRQKSVISHAVSEKMAKDINKLKRRMDFKTPKSPYLVINTAENEFILYSGKKVLRKGICSTGSYVMLEKDEQEKWIFRTPKGIFSIKDKNTNPVWKKPDWAFIEEGLPVPSINHPSRFEYGVLGEYSLSLGGGYLIHGTLYKRFLGMPVTHGCIRMNDEDLKVVFQTMGFGSKVYIY